MTPREYSKRKKKYLFGQNNIDNDKPHWKKLQGYVVVVDGTKRHNVLPSLMFAVDVEGENLYSINSYWIFDRCMFGRISLLAGFRARPYAYGALNEYTKKHLEEKCFKNLTYENIVNLVTDIYPDIFIPTKEQFYSEFGLMYDTETGYITNPLNLES